MVQKTNITGVELKNALTESFTNHVNEDDNYNIVVKPALSLLCARRFDVVAKYLYANYCQQDIQCDYAREVYVEHIRAFNNFVEADGSGKIGKDGFIVAMDKLMCSLKGNGYFKDSPIPMSRDGIILDGAHRVGLSLAMEMDVFTVKLDIDSPVYDYSYFRERGMPDNHLDTLALQYARLKKNTRLIILWPSSQGNQQQVESILRHYGDIVYFKELYLNKSGAHSFVSIVYKRESWVGSIKDGYAGAKNKANWCFSKKSPLRVYLFESTKDLIKMKDEVRDVFSIGKHSIHVNDTHEETIELSEYLFNENSVTFLNAMVHRDLRWFNRLFSHYQDWLKQNALNNESFCIDGSGSLAAFGVRDVRDLDYLYSGNGDVPSTGFKEIDCHNDEHQHDGMIPDQIIYDPRNFFYFCGQKFISIDLIRALKVRRNEIKDRDDVQAIDGLLNGRPVKIPWKKKLERMLSVHYMKARIKLFALKMRYHLLRLRNGIK